MCFSESCDGNVDAAGVSPAVSTFSLQWRIKEEVDLKSTDGGFIFWGTPLPKQVEGDRKSETSGENPLTFQPRRTLRGAFDLMILWLKIVGKKSPFFEKHYIIDEI